jgi:hypothetical protein
LRGRLLEQGQCLRTKGNICVHVRKSLEVMIRGKGVTAMVKLTARGNAEIGQYHNPDMHSLEQLAYHGLTFPHIRCVERHL